MKRFRMYVDVSVYGGCYDEEFSEDSLRFFDLVRDGRCILLVSPVVRGELLGAPSDVQSILSCLPRKHVESVAVTAEMLDLRDAYLAAEVVTRKWIDDATHVAVATVAGADAVLSWNFRHLVNLRRSLCFNAVNTAQGYGAMRIISPKEFGYDDRDEDH